jgi:hypothetical protein
MRGASRAFTNECAVKNTVQFKTRRKYVPVGSDAASMPHTVLNRTVFSTCAPLVSTRANIVQSIPLVTRSVLCNEYDP